MGSCIRGPQLPSLIGAAIESALLDVGEKRFQRIKILRQEGVEFVVVAFAATERRPQPGAAHIADALGDVLGEIFLGLHAPLGTHHAQTVVARGNFVFDGRLRAAGRRPIVPA